MPDELAPLSEEARKLALDRFRILKPHLEHSQSLRSVAPAAGIPYRTAHRWLAEYRRFGLAALARKARVDRGERRAASVDLKQAIEGLALQKPPLPIAALYRQVRAIAQQRGEAVPSYSVVYDIVHKPSCGQLGAMPAIDRLAYMEVEFEEIAQRLQICRIECSVSFR